MFDTVLKEVTQGGRLALNLPLKKASSIGKLWFSCLEWHQTGGCGFIWALQQL